MRKPALLLTLLFFVSCRAPSYEQLLIWELLTTYGHIFTYARDDKPVEYTLASTSSPAYTVTHTFTNLTTPNGSFAHGTDTMTFSGTGLPPSSATFSMRIRTGSGGTEHAVYWEMNRVAGRPVFSNFSIDGVSYQDHVTELADFYEHTFWLPPPN